MDLKDEIEAAHGVAVAQTALLSALIGVLRARGVLTRETEDVMVDAAITQIETSPVIAPGLAMRARKVLDVIAQELAGRPTNPPREP